MKFVCACCIYFSHTHNRGCTFTSCLYSIISFLVEVPGLEPYREYLYTHLRVQPIWTSMRFWTAAFFDAVQCERASRPIPPRPKSLDQESIAAEDRRFQANIVFGQLG